MIGRALAEGLADRYALSLMSRSIDGTDLTRTDTLADRLVGHDAVVHLAWQYADPERRPTLGYFDNLAMSRSVLLAARAAGVPRVVMASSVHADYFYDHVGPELISPDRTPRGNDVYGCAKVMVEQLGRELAGDGLHVCTVRYGAVTPGGSPHPTDAWERRVWLSRRDLCNLIVRIVESSAPPEAALVYAVSDNEGRAHDTANPFGWEPVDRAEALAEVRP